MKLYMYSVYDSVAEVFNKPFYEINDASATRAFKQSIDDNPNRLDYSLYLVGSYNDNTAQLNPLTLKKVCSAFDVKSTEEQSQD